MPYYRRFTPLLSLLGLCVLFGAAFAVRSLIERNVTDAAPSKEARTDVRAEAFTSSPLDIPASAPFTLKSHAGMLCVYDSAGTEVYRTALPDAGVLTDTDRIMLERDGYTFAARSELIEFLLVLETPSPP